MKILDWNPERGLARQGDVILMRLPPWVHIDRNAPVIKPRYDGRLILAEGEATGHHHSVLARSFSPLMFRDMAVLVGHPGSSNGEPPVFVEPQEVKVETVGRATLYDDSRAYVVLAHANIITGPRNNVVGCMVVEGAPAVLEHQEHDAIRIPEGEYFVGRQTSLQGDILAHVLD